MTRRGRGRRARHIDGDAYDPQEEVVRGRLDRYINYSTGLMGAISFGSIFLYKFDLRAAFGLEEVSLFSLPEIWAALSAPEFLDRLAAFLRAEGWPVALFLVTALAYSWYLRAVRRELGIMSTLFARLNPPREYKALLESKSVPVLALGLTLSFILLALSCDDLVIYCLIMLALNALDYHGNFIIRLNLRKFLGDASLKPAAADPESRAVLARRRVAEVYWLERWQLRRIGILMIGNALVLLLAATPLLGLVPPAPIEAARLPLAYAILIGLIFWNEWLITGWRVERDAELRRINREESRALYPERR